MSSTSHDLPNVDLGGAVLSTVLRTSEKSVLALGDRDGLPVMIKMLRTDNDFWQAKFAHEIQLYRAFAETPPPAAVPKLVHTDEQGVLVIEHIPGQVVDAERYPERALDTSTLDAVLDTVTAFARWVPRPGVLEPVFDYPDRVERYHHAGFFDADDRAVLHALLETVSPPSQTGHGDPLPSNLLLADAGGCVLLDFEFTGLFLPGFDLAMLHTILAETPGAQDRIESLAIDAEIEVPFLINQAMVLSRELRLHTELADDDVRARRLALLESEWEAVRRHLHARR